MPSLKLRPDLSFGIKRGPLDVRTITTTATLDAEDELLLLDSSGGAFTLSLPKATDDLRDYYVLKLTTGSATVTVDPDGSETIDGSATDTASLTAAADCIWIAPDGSNWRIIARMT